MEYENGAVMGEHVLIVDDDIDLVLTYQELLQAHGYRSSTAANGALALKLLQKEGVDAIICDLSMPELTGDLFYLEVGRHWPHLMNRFIFLTAYADNPVYASFLKGVRVPVLSKPVSIECLLKALHGTLGRVPRAAV
jgi:CheY-like chemotaxis protein